MANDDPHQRAVQLMLEGAALEGDLTVPAGVRGVVLFAHGSGSSRHSPRNRQVAAGLHQAGFATLLMDLLTADEEQVDLRTRELRFAIPLLAARLTGALDWLAQDEDTTALAVATFGASTGAAAALSTAAQRPERVCGVISRGGRVDLAGDALAQVRAPTLLIVGGNGPTVLALNEKAAAGLDAGVALAIVPGATHLFEEPGALETVIDLAVGSLDRWLGA